MTRAVLALGGAAAVMAAALALNFQTNQPGVGGPTTPAPTASQSPAAIPRPLPAEQGDVIARQVAALNSRDGEAFVELFADEPNAGFDPRGAFESSSIPMNHMLAIRDRHLIEPYLSINEAWRFEAEVVACHRLSPDEYASRYVPSGDRSETFAHCAVTSRWPALALEIGEWWAYEFDGTDLHWWQQRVRDAAPADRTLGLGLDGLLAWESWLESTDPAAAARLLNPREFPVAVPCGPGTYLDENHRTFSASEPPCAWSSDGVDVERIVSEQRYGRAQDAWSIAGERFMPNPLVPYDPALADEIEASIEEFFRR